MKVQWPRGDEQDGWVLLETILEQQPRVMEEAATKQIADERQVGGRITTEADDKVEIDSYKKHFCLYD